MYNYTKDKKILNNKKNYCRFNVLTVEPGFNRKIFRERDSISTLYSITVVYINLKR